MATYSNDVDLARRAQNGDERAWHELFEQHMDRLYAFLYYRMGRREQEAEDVTQETFMIAARKLSQYNGTSSFFTWLCGIGKLKLREWQRARTRRSRWELAMDHLDETFQAPEAMDPAPLPSEWLERDEIGRFIDATWSTLPSHYQHALEGKYLLGFSVEVLARQAECSEKAMESLLIRARAAFKAAFLTLNSAQETLVS